MAKRTWSDEDRKRHRDGYARRAERKGMVHALAWKRDHFTNACGLNAKYFEPKIARTRQQVLESDMPQGKMYFFTQDQLKDRVTCGKCKKFNVFQGKRPNSNKGNSHPPLDPVKLVAALEARGYKVEPPPEPEPKETFTFNSKKYPLFCELFREFFQMFSAE